MDIGMVQSIQDIGWMISRMDRALRNGQMDQYTRDNLK